MSGKLPDGWAYSSIGDVAAIESNLVDPKDYQNYTHIAPNHIESNTGKLFEYTTIAQDKVKSPKHLFFSGQILYSKIRPYLAKAIIVDFTGLCSADMYPIRADIEPSYLYRWILSAKAEDKAKG